MAYFDGIKVGDKVYSANDDEWIVVCLWKFDDFRVTKNRREMTVQNDGSLSGFRGIGQVFFWQPPNITPPPRPKRKVKKVLERWVNVYAENLHTTKEEADMGAPQLNIESPASN